MFTKIRRRIPVRIRQNWLPLTAGVAAVAVGLTVFGDVAIRPLSTSTAPVVGEDEQITEDIAGTADLFDDTVDHEITISYSQTDYNTMLDEYFTEGEKDWMPAESRSTARRSRTSASA